MLDNVNSVNTTAMEMKIKTHYPRISRDFISKYTRNVRNEDCFDGNRNRKIVLSRQTVNRIKIIISPRSYGKTKLSFPCGVKN